MFEKDEITKQIKFSHNPFSMPQGDLTDKELENVIEYLDPEEVITLTGADEDINFKLPAEL